MPGEMQAFTALLPGSTTVNATNGTINGTAFVTVDVGMVSCLNANEEDQSVCTPYPDLNL